MLRADDDGCVFTVKASSIHTAHWVTWIAQGQEWVGARMDEDSKKLRELAVERARSDKQAAYDSGSERQREQWIRQAEHTLLEEEQDGGTRPSELQRYPESPPALFIMWDCHHAIRRWRKNNPNKSSEAIIARGDPGQQTVAPTVRRMTDDEDEDDENVSSGVEEQEGSTKRASPTKRKGAHSHPSPSPLCSTMHRG